MLGILKSIFGGMLGLATSKSDGSVVGKALDIAAEKVVDVDKLAQLLAGIIQQQQQLDAAPSWVQAIKDVTAQTPASVRIAVAAWIWGDVAHKLARTVLWLAVIGASVFIIYQKAKAGHPVSQDDITTIALLAAGPGAYTLLKGVGRSK